MSHCYSILSLRKNTDTGRPGPTYWEVIDTSTEVVNAHGFVTTSPTSYGLFEKIEDAVKRFEEIELMLEEILRVKDELFFLEDDDDWEPTREEILEAESNDPSNWDDERWEQNSRELQARLGDAYLDLSQKGESSDA